ncbi:MAG TPA: AAA family ATPase, partial [Kofleriaceae bacterium]
MTDIAEQDEAHRRFGAVYFTSLSVAGVRCFGPEQTLSLTHGDRPAKWTVILGENGVGKTTLLQCAWAMAPCVEPRPGALVGRYPVGSYPRGFLAPGRLELHRAATSKLSIRAEVVLAQSLTSGKTGTPAYCSVEADARKIGHSGGYPNWANVVCCGYGALRRSGEVSVEASASKHSAASLFSDDAVLDSGSEWLIRADYAANSTTDPRVRARRDKIQAALIDLLPDVSDIRVAGLNEQPPQPRIDVQTPYGWVPMRALSLGYRSMVAWVVDLASLMFDSFPDSIDPLAEPAIALVDEIDLHLHPRWQREITAHLDRLFPNVQFIVTAHSPLMVQGAGVT